MPGENYTGPAALDHEAGAISYDVCIGRLSQLASVPHAGLVQALVDLVRDPARRRAMGQAAQDRARRVFDWPIVMASHRALWRELEDRRRAAGTVECPLAVSPARGDPGRVFASYPTVALGPGSRGPSCVRASGCLPCRVVGGRPWRAWVERFSGRPHGPGEP